ncbi:MAG: glycosyl transferase, partial [Thalassobaculaceae bacterium]
MNALLTAAPPPLIAALVALVGTGLLIGALTRRQILDHPNHRSSHDRPTPRGGGIAVMAAIIAGWGA